MKRQIGEGGFEREEMYLVVVGRSKYIFVEMPMRIGARGGGGEEAMLVDKVQEKEHGSE